ncbi:MAG TPA: hypothetical protein VJ785_17150 [Anaerolineales bacterium]|nr:hypothetical protein [Anaerolineales bacterium]
MDNGSRHTSEETAEFLENRTPHVQVLFTATHASWLNQAESLLPAFRTRYLIRASWCSRPPMVSILSRAGKSTIKGTHILSTGNGPVAISSIGSTTLLAEFVANLDPPTPSKAGMVVDELSIVPGRRT